jgi:hypothetical protein
MPKNDEIRDLREREQELEAQLRALREQRAQLEGRRDAVEVAKRSPGKRALRDVVLDLLAEAGTPLNSLLIANVLRPLYGRAVPSTRFGTLSKDEQTSHSSGRAREVYLCHCLTHDQGQAMKRFWARSDWPLAERLVGPMTGRLLFLKGAAWTIRLARDHSVQATEPALLNYVAADQARDAGAKVARDEFPYEEWLAVIDEQICRHGPEDEKIRAKAAEHLQFKLSEAELLFGTRPPFINLPGSTPHWKSASK